MRTSAASPRGLEPCRWRSAGCLITYTSWSDFDHVIDMIIFSETLRLIRRNGFTGRLAYDFCLAKRIRRFFGKSVKSEKSQKYVLNQENHHKRVTFQDEYLNLLRASGVEYDERYVW